MEVLKREEDNICTLTINRPAKRNSLSEKALMILGDAFLALEKEKQSRVIILRGAGEKAFCAGAEISPFPAQERLEPPIKALQYCLEGMLNCSLPVIAMIYGYAIGAGLDLVVLSDLRLAADNALFGVNLVKLGRIYYYTAVQRLMQLIGLGATKEMLLSGRLIKAPRAKEIGLINVVFSTPGLEAYTYNLARELAQENAPLAMQATKKMLKKLLVSEINTDLQNELQALTDWINQSQDAQEGPLAFMEKRKPIFKGR